jgi:hypothetical protein
MNRKFTTFAAAALVALVFSSTALARHSRHHHSHSVKIASSVTPTVVPDNPADCTTGTAQHPGLGITGASTLVYGSSKSGTATAPGVTIHVTTSDGITFDFSATFSSPIAGEKILAVYAKGGSQGGNLYDYRPNGVLADSGLHPPPTGNGAQFATISHLLFCYGAGSVSSPGSGPGGNNGTSPSNTTSGTTPGVTVTAPSSSAPGTQGTSPTGPQHKATSKHKLKAKKVKHVLSRRARRRAGFTG